MLLGRGKVVNLFLVLVGVVHVAGLEGRSVDVGVLPLQMSINVGLTSGGCIALMAAPQLPRAAQSCWWEPVPGINTEGCNFGWFILVVQLK